MFMFGLKLEMLCVHYSANPMDKGKRKDLDLLAKLLLPQKHFSPENQTCTMSKMQNLIYLGITHHVTVFSSRKRSCLSHLST